MAGDRAPFQTVRRLLPFTTVALLIAAIYTGWIFFSRWQRNRTIEQERHAKEAAADSHVLQELGGNSLKIESFSATPPAVAPNGRVLLCYGVNNAATVSIDPHVPDVWPALSRCVEVHPVRTTEYTLTAKDAAGHATTEKLTVTVQ